MSLDTSSLVRLVPDELASGDATGHESLDIHLERYRFAALHAPPGRLLDLACGAGYGTRVLADEAEHVSEAVGVDISPDAVSYACQRYARPGVSYRVADGGEFVDAEGFDTIVSLETIEHVPAPGELVDHLVGLLRPGGVLIASVPTTPSVDVNPHHLHDFTERTFRGLFQQHELQEVTALRQEQRFKPLRIVRRQEQRVADLRPGLLGWYAEHPGSLARRVLATLRHGFTNRYITIAWQSAAP
jgi:SAM-dependent methyltransferase